MTLKQIFTSLVANAELENGLVNVDSLDFEAYRKIIPAKLVPEGVDNELLWQIVIGKLIKVHDFTNESRSWSEEEKRDIVAQLCRIFSGMPYKYDFYFKLPETYPLGPEELTSEIGIVIPNQVSIDTLEKTNPQSDFDKLMGLKGQKNNSRLLKPGEKYFKVTDKGMVVSGVHAYLEAPYSPDRLVGIFIALHLACGNADTKSISNQSLDPKVYDNNHVYRANFASPLKESRALSVKFDATEDDIKQGNIIFIKLLNRNSNSELEVSRVQLINSLYWYIQSLNASEPSLRVVFLVSAFDSLFSYEKGGMLVPAAKEKIPVIAELVSGNEIKRLELFKVLKELYIKRNGIIHGSTEISGYNRLTRKEFRLIAELAERAEPIYKEFVITKIKKYVS